MVRVVIFDFDGVIADTETIHFSCLRTVLAEEKKINLDRKIYDELYLALDDRACFKKALSSVEIEITEAKIDEMISKKSNLFLTYLQEIKLFPGIVEWIEEASTKFTLAICSGALRKEIVDILSSNHLLRHFTVITSAEDFIESKPSPEGYLKTLQNLNRQLGNQVEIRASECLVIEDSIAGIRAARAAGMPCVAITNSYPMEQLREANIVINNITDLDIENIRYLSL